MKKELKEIIKNCEESMKIHEWFLKNDKIELPSNYYINMGKKDICEYLLDKLEEPQEHKIPEKIPLQYADNRKSEEVYEYLRCKINEILDYLEKKQ